LDRRVSTNPEAYTPQKLEETMGYKVTFFRDKKAVYTKALPCDLKAATAHAKAHLPMQSSEHRATSVTVTCERTGEVMFTLADQPVPA